MSKSTSETMDLSFLLKEGMERGSNISILPHALPDDLADKAYAILASADDSAWQEQRGRPGAFPMRYSRYVGKALSSITDVLRCELARVLELQPHESIVINASR